MPDYLEARFNQCLRDSGLTHDEFVAQSDQELLRWPNLGRKTLRYIRETYGGPALSTYLAKFTDQDLWNELNRRAEARRFPRLTDHE